MPVVVSWSPKEWQEQLRKRLESCRKHREPWDSQGEMNAQVVFNRNGREIRKDDIGVAISGVLQNAEPSVDGGDTEVGTNLILKLLRFRHGQLAANPPSAIASPASPDISDRQKADGADRVIRHGYHQDKVQEKFDQAIWKALIRGTGWVKCVWDPSKGDVFDFTEETREIKMNGDIGVYSPRTQDVWVDPIAKVWEDARYVFERHYLSYEEACFQFPEAKKQLKKAITGQDSPYGKEVAKEEIVEIYEYYEKGMPLNGMAGRRAFCTADGSLLATPTKNPHYKARLPYYLTTDVDVDDQVYGKSLVEFTSRMQDLMSRFDSASVDAMELHGVIRMAVPESAEINDDEIANNNIEIVRYSGAIPPHFLNPVALPPDLVRLRNQWKEEIQDIMGINDSMLGLQKREQSGFSQQTAIEAGNIANRRIINKYTRMVRDFWQDYLGLVKENWTIGRLINTVGKEKSFESREIKGADIAGGYDLIVEYGASLPLDPNMRREQIMLLMQPLQQAGVPMTRILRLLKLNELDTVYDELEQGEDRQREIFDEMVALAKTGDPQYIPPQELELHEPYLIYCQKYRNSMEYKVLPEEVKPLIEQHIRERMDMAARVQQQGPAGMAASQQPQGLVGPALATAPTVLA